MAETSDSYEKLYRDAYVAGRERGWRDAGALDKASNILKAWRYATGNAKPTVVELGCGEGAIAARLAELEFFSSYRGFDLSESGIVEARARQVPGAEFARVTDSKIALPDDSADLVILSHVVEHLEHPRALLYEARRLATWVLVEVPLERTWRTPPDFVRDDLGHINLYDRTTIRHLLQSCDLGIACQFTTHPGSASYFFNGSGPKRRLAYQVKRFGLGAAPKLARASMVYHETLLGRRTE